ncbi:hypothetical protein GCM10010252_23390 [Streptomyces aureoverticillatus]|nr:hypothetical protein GCM10010252_23390 [Streptomyces aureoverticillatus]
MREPAHVRGLGLEDVEGDPLRALGTDAGQPAQFVDEVLDHAFVHGVPSSFRPGPRTSGPLAGLRIFGLQSSGLRELLYVP